MCFRVKSTGTELSPESTSKLHVRFIRLPRQVLELYDELVYRSRSVVVGRSRVTSSHSVSFDGEVVLARGFPITYFELMGKWYSVLKVRNLRGRHTGYYCDIATPPRLLEDGGIEFTDLFVDVWVSPDLRYKVLDEEELENAYTRGWISKRLYERAKKEVTNIANAIDRERFPPKHVKRLEVKLNL